MDYSKNNSPLTKVFNQTNMVDVWLSTLTFDGFTLSPVPMQHNESRIDINMYL